jgi:hypothetical protein
MQRLLCVYVSESGQGGCSLRRRLAARAEPVSEQQSAWAKPTLAGQHDIRQLSPALPTLPAC